MKNKQNLSTPAVLHLNVIADSDFLSPYSSGNTPVISSEVADFLENAASAYHPDKELILNVSGDCISDDERQIYTQAIKNYYSLKLTDIRRSLHRKAKIAAWFAIIGILALSFMFLCDGLNVYQLWIECVDIFAWVFLWEAVDQFFIERASLLITQKRYSKFVEMQCLFH